MSLYTHFNPNPKGKSTGDCVIRMICAIRGIKWAQAYLELSQIVLEEYEMPSDNDIWELYLIDLGFKKRLLPDYCPRCYTVSHFTYDNPEGIFVVCTGSHVVAVIDGSYYDAWDSGNETVNYIFTYDN